MKENLSTDTHFPVVSLQGVSKYYGSHQALNDVHLDVHPGEVLAFLGPNGAGKTTAIQIMLGLRQASQGSVKLFGETPGPRVRNRIGVMLQDSGLPENLTVAELIRLFASYYPYSLPVEEVLERADLVAKRKAMVRQLSGGQRQRLYFALAIIGDPDLIFLDEPTVAMDVSARRIFWQQLQEFAALGKTVLFSTHYLDEADEMADRIVVMHQGAVLKDGSPQDIKRLVAAKTVKLKTDLSLASAQGFKGVERAEKQNGHLLVYTNEPETFLQSLMLENYTMTDLTVIDTDLEAAFVSLTRTQA
ncbi:MAG: ABC transporter ATP-binding protein [Trueperaceae bacterium]|nr:ABC transporter ATP-binding protein [Trueperaceae bacterium]